MPDEKNSDNAAESTAEDRRKDCLDHQEALIDESLKESFPASDPPSIARPDCLDDEGRTD